MKHTLVALVENKPGVLARVAGLFRRRNFNIDSLTVGTTEDPTISRMTIVVDSTVADASLVERNLYKMVNVLFVQDISSEPSVTRDLALVKVAANAEKRAEIIQLVDIYKARIVDVGQTTVIVEMTGSPAKVDQFIQLLEQFGIREMVRTGLVAMKRGDEPMFQEDTDEHARGEWRVITNG
ncbi:MAG: acetolactate synthase small subunit [Anaerolineae bacterium]|nr:acetolactate synthase small subunit [Anaerolineae bacterium]